MRVCVNLVIYNTYIYEKKQIETVCNYDFCASLHRSTLSESSNQKQSDYPFMHLLYSQLLVCQRVCLQNTVCLICK